MGVNWTLEELALKGFSVDGKRHQSQKQKAADRKIKRIDAAENSLQIRAESYLKKLGIYYVHLKNAKKNRKGIPDLLICLNGRFVGVELKTKTGLTPEQKAEREKIIFSGGKYFIIQTLEDFILLIAKLKGEVKKRLENDK
jgi:hypothetical protein